MEIALHEFKVFYENDIYSKNLLFLLINTAACLAQSVERNALNVVVEGSSPSVGIFFF